MASQYTFGDSELAAERLAMVAEIFDPVSRAFLESAVPQGVELAIDLGCGPGYTTRLVAEVCSPRRTLGLDRSAPFVELARSLHGGRTIDFATHDVTVVPLPGAPVDIVHARLLLAHLPDPLGLVERWRAQLRPAGVLVLDEIEAMLTPPGALRRYERLAVALVTTAGGPMYAGPILAPLGGRHPVVDIDAAIAARMYGMNLATWRHDARLRGLADDTELDRLAHDLREMAVQPGDDVVRWVLRQIVVTS